jgi:photosystem II stability/assembly factor-like uncharacterized protein
MRNKGILLFALTMMVVGAVALAAEKKPDSPWKLIVESRINHKSTIAGFVDGTHGITAGYSGECHYTTDSGKSWPSGTNISACRFGLEIVNDKIAWTCGNQGNNRVTMDGGCSWSPISNFGKTEPNQCRFLSFIDDKAGWIASPFGMMAKTTNGGETWVPLKLPDGIDDIAALSLLTKDIGYVLDMSGIIYKTSDAGETWSTIDSGFKDAPMMMMLSAPQEAMRFIDEKRGIIVACLNDKKVYASVTTDGGNTWTRESVPAVMGALFLAHDGRTLTVSQSKVIKVYQRSAF